MPEENLPENTDINPVVSETTSSLESEAVSVDPALSAPSPKLKKATSFMANKNEVAWDIGSSSFKIVTATTNNNGLEIQQVLEIPNPVGVAVPEEKTKMDQMKGIVGSIIKEYDLPLRGVRLALPESVVSTQVIEMPILSSAELSSSIAWQAEQYLPIPKDELVTEYEVIYKPDNAGATAAEQNMRVLLIGTRKQLIDNLVEIFRDNGAEPYLLETQTVSLMRQLGLGQADAVTMLVQIGASSMSIIALQRGELVFVLSYPEAGDLLTKALVTGFSLSKENAEAYKQTYGLLPDQADGKIFNALKPVADMLVGNVRNAISFFSSKTNNQTKIEQVILCGGGAQLLGFVDYLQTAIQIQVGLIDNFNGLAGTVPEKNQLSYGVALGLLKRPM